MCSTEAISQTSVIARQRQNQVNLRVDQQLLPDFRTVCVSTFAAVKSYCDRKDGSILDAFSRSWRLAAKADGVEGGVEVRAKSWYQMFYAELDWRMQIPLTHKRGIGTVGAFAPLCLGPFTILILLVESGPSAPV
jgi:hypothetical protein